MTSSVLTPTLPVEPKTTIWRVIESNKDQRSGRQRGGYRVDAIEHSAMAREDAATILDLGTTLDPRFKQIANDAESGTAHHFEIKERELANVEG